MKRTKRNVRPIRVSVPEALQILQSAIGYCQLAGLTVQGTNSKTGLTLVIPGVFYAAGQTDNGMVFRIGSPPSNEGDVMGKSEGESPR